MVRRLFLRQNHTVRASLQSFLVKAMNLRTLDLALLSIIQWRHHGKILDKRMLTLVFRFLQALQLCRARFLRVSFTCPLLGLVESLSTPPNDGDGFIVVVCQREQGPENVRLKPRSLVNLPKSIAMLMTLVFPVRK